MSDVFERFTDKSRLVVTLGQDEARAFNHNYIGTEHILLGLLRVDGGLAQLVLAELGLEIEYVRQRIDGIVGRGEETPVGQIPLTPRCKKVLENSLREALSLGHNYIGTEHVLLGLVRENEGVGARILLDKDLDPETVRQAISSHLVGPKRWYGGVTRVAQATDDDKEVLSALAQKVSALKDEALDAGFVELAASLRLLEREIT